MGHIQARCPRLEGARTAAHHQIARRLLAEVERRQRGDREDFTLETEVEVRAIKDMAPHRCGDSAGTAFPRRTLRPLTLAGCAQTL